MARIGNAGKALEGIFSEIYSGRSAIEANAITGPDVVFAAGRDSPPGKYMNGAECRSGPRYRCRAYTHPLS